MRKTNPYTNPCPLCGGAAEKFCQVTGIIYFKCPVCRGVFLSKEFYLAEEEEKKRYLEHNNDVNDPAYREFARPAADYITANFPPRTSEGLDFGAGTGPVVSRLLEEKGFSAAPYDPFFHPGRECLERKYDFIIASEVIEHFKNPHAEFKLLESLLKSPGALAVRTHLFEEGEVFENWYYRKDPTHVFFYTVKTLEWIKKGFNFSGLEVNGKLIILKK